MPLTIADINALLADAPANNITALEMRTIFADIMPTGKSGLFVAALNASAMERAHADYICDGTDDNVEITAAIAASPNRVVELSAGTFTVSAASITLLSGMHLRGQGTSTIIRMKQSGNGRLIYSTAALTDITFEGVTFDMNGANQSNGAGRDDRSGLMLENITGLKLYHCTVKNTRHGAAVRLSNCSQILYLGNRFLNNGVAGAAFVSDHTFTRNSDYYRVVGNYFDSATDTGTAQDGVQHSTVTGNVYVNNDLGVSICNSAPEGATPARYSRWNTINANVVSGTGAGHQSVGIKVSTFGNTAPGNMRDGTIVGNTINNCDRSMWVEECDRMVIANNILSDAAGTNGQLLLLATTGVINDLLIQGNVIYNTTNRGISFDAGAGAAAVNVRVFDNTISACAGGAVNGTIPTGTQFRRNQGYMTENTGATSIADGGTIMHGLAVTPANVRVTPTVAGEMVAVTAKGATTFTVSIKKHDNSAGTTQTVYWEAIAYEGAAPLGSYTTQDVSYTEDTAAIIGPGRGMQESYETYYGLPMPMDYGAEVPAGETTPRRAIYLSPADAVLSAGTLTDLGTELASAQTAGKSIELRFLYAAGFGDPEPPFSRILLHVAQLAAVVNPYAHIIHNLETGMIGPWGEGHDVESVGITEADEPFYGSTFPKRLQLWRAWTNGAPNLRAVAWRYAWQAMWAEGQMTAGEKAKMAFHCDQFLAGDADDPSHGGTFRGSWGPDTSEIDAQKAWLTTFTLTHLLRAETDWDDPGAYAAAHVDDDGFARYKPSTWRDIRGLMPTWSAGKQAEILRNLGYRLVLVSATLPGGTVTVGQTVGVTFTIRNEGYSRPAHSRPVYLMFGTTRALLSGVNAQQWAAGATIVVNTTCVVPAGTGSKALKLWLPDAAAAIEADSDFAIRLANTSIFDTGTGYNDLAASVTVA